MVCGCGIELPRLTVSAAHPPAHPPPTVHLVPAAPIWSLSNRDMIVKLMGAPDGGCKWTAEPASRAENEALMDALQSGH
jgi:hypothetical protein